MKPRTAIVLVAAAALVSFAAGRLASQSEGDEAKAMEAYLTPGKEHQLLAKRAGHWDFQAKMWMAPGAPPIESKGHTEVKSILGGRYTVEEAEGPAIAEFGGQPFKGLGLGGYDNYRKKYISTWMDSMGTGIMLFEGEASKDGKEFVFTSEEPDFAKGAGKMAKVRSVEKHQDDDHYTFSMFHPGPDGKEVKYFELSYTRRK